MDNFILTNTIENMSWQHVTEAYKNKFRKSYIACQFTYERDFIINTITNEFPEYDKNTVTAAVIHSCRKISPPRLGEDFFNTVAGILSHHENDGSKRRAKDT